MFNVFKNKKRECIKAPVYEGLNELFCLEFYSNNDIFKSKNHQHKWLVNSDDPQFICQNSSLSAYENYWMEISFKCVADSGELIKDIELFLDTGKGFSELEKIHIIDSDLENKFHFKLPKNLKSIRIDPTKKTNDIYIENFEIFISKQPLQSQFTFNSDQHGQLIKGSNLSLIAINHLEKSPTEFDWYSTGNDPQFEAKSNDSCLPKGWYKLKLKISSTQPILDAKLYLNHRKNFKEEESFLIKVASSQEIERFFYSDKKIVSFRLDPFDCKGHFTIDFIEIIKVDISPDIKQKAKVLVSEQQSNLPENIYVKLINFFIAKLHRFPRLRYFYLKFSKHEQYRLYQKWINEVEGRFNTDINFFKAHHNKKQLPSFSVVIPTYNTQVNLLKECLASIIEQGYDNVEVCISDDGSTNKDTLEYLSQLVNAAQVNVILSEKNRGIAQTTNDAMKLAKNDYILFVDHDDKLGTNALWHIAEYILSNPNKKFIYSDEDKINESGKRFEPHFKPAWSPDLLLSQNYISHLSIVERNLAVVSEGLDTKLNGAQDYDFILRATSEVRQEQIGHIPKILYHWRAISGSTAASPEEKNYTTIAGQMALQKHFDEKSVKLKLGKYPNTYHVQWQLPNKLPLVSIIIPTKNNHQVLSKCIESIKNLCGYNHYEIIIINNQSTDAETIKYYQQIKSYEHISVVDYDRPFNYSEINNWAVKQHAKGDLILLANDDIEFISPDFLQEMVGQACRDEVGCVGAKLLYPNNKVQHCGVVLGINGVAGHSHKYLEHDKHGYFSRPHITHNVSAVTAACLMVRRTLFDIVNGLDEDNLAIAFNDVDFCLKLREKGYLNIVCPNILAYHYESLSRGQEDTLEKQNRFAKEVHFMQTKWKDKLTSDPYYSENLTLTSENFSIKKPFEYE